MPFEISSENIWRKFLNTVFFILGIILLGSGTMFLRPEKIQKHDSLDTVHVEKLKDLLIK